MTKAVTFAIAIVFTLSLWLRAEKKQHIFTIYLQTSFDFTDHAPCGLDKTASCIQVIRFYDADSGQLLAGAAASANIPGPEAIIGTANVSSIPRRVYAVTVYLDNTGAVKEGLPGQVTELIPHAAH
jgi:hypothetical protein